MMNTPTNTAQPPVISTPTVPVKARVKGGLSSETVKIVHAPPPVLEFEGPPRIISKDGKVYQGFRKAGFVGYIPDATFPPGEPYMGWEGRKISHAVWSAVMAFFEWGYEEFKSETQVRLYYHPVRGEWAAWAYPQTPNGMTTSELPDDPEYIKQRNERFPASQWYLLGTIHNHCMVGAFQSGTDLHNESQQDGVHITVGKISTAEYDLHGRVIVRGTQYDIHWAQWLDFSPDMKKVLPYVPKGLHNALFEGQLKMPPPKDAEFPAIWKTNCKKPVYSGRGSGSHSGTFHSGGTHTLIIKTDLRSQFTSKEIEFMREAMACYDNLKMTHTAVDNLIALDKDKMVDTDWQIVVGFIAIGRKFNVDQDRLDELFDKWDFPTVLKELDSETTTTTTA